jgi:hypothetical protein
MILYCSCKQIYSPVFFLLQLYVHAPLMHKPMLVSRGSDQELVQLLEKSCCRYWTNRELESRHRGEYCFSCLAYCWLHGVNQICGFGFQYMSRKQGNVWIEVWVLHLFKNALPEMLLLEEVSCSTMDVDHIKWLLRPMYSYSRTIGDS